MIKIYGIPNCAACVAAKNICTQRALEHEYIDMSTMSIDETTELTDKFGVIRQAPLLVRNGVRISTEDLKG